MRDINAGRPRRIELEEMSDGRWRFEVLTGDSKVLDYSFASTPWLAWRMARASWRRALRLFRKGYGAG